MPSYEIIFDNEMLKALFIEWLIECGEIDEFVNYLKQEYEVDINVVYDPMGQPIISEG